MRHGRCWCLCAGASKQICLLTKAGAFYVCSQVKIPAVVSVGCCPRSSSTSAAKMKISVEFSLK